jgi:hypothetical protein
LNEKKKRWAVQNEMSSSELVPLLGEIRDQLKRLADLLEGATNGLHNLNVEIGEPTIKIRDPTDFRKHAGSR